MSRRRRPFHFGGRPPWAHAGEGPLSGRGWDWPERRRFMFFRFARLAGLVVAFFLLATAGLALFFTYLAGGGGQTALLVWLAAIGMALVFIGLMAHFVRRTFANILTPLAQVMAAADAVAEGDLHVRIPEQGPEEVVRLARSFNRMVAELERGDEQRRALTADVAHELRTPLHILQGNLEGILDGIYQPDAVQLGLLLDETRQLSRLVEDLRTLTLADAGQLSLKLEELDAGELLADVATSFSGQAEAAGVTLSVQPGEDEPGPPIWGDAGRLYQVLSNLVANALRHTPAGGAVGLSAAPAAEGVRLVVSDNGAGIPEEDLPYIFDRFWRSDRARSRAPGEEGTGLGLAIARQLVQAHGGRIQVESRPGQGSTFTIVLPPGPAGAGPQANR